jgi:hypothetical protein
MNWPEFFKNEAISNYIVFALGIVVATVGWGIAQYISRKKPQIIGVVRIKEESLLKIDSNVKQDIAIEYKGSPIQSLYRTKYRILNRGESVIDNAQLEIQIEHKNGSEILYYTIVDESGKNLSGAKVSDVRTTARKQEIQVDLDFLNPYSGYKERIVLDVYSSQPFQTISANGRGRGWNVKYFDQVQYDDEISSTAYVLLSGNIIEKMIALAELGVRRLK